MAFNKKMDTDGKAVILGGRQKDLFPKGFKYIIGGDMFTVTKAYTSDNTEFRRVVCNNGTVEDITVTSLIKDFTEQPDNVEVTVVENPSTEEIEEETEKTEE